MVNSIQKLKFFGGRHYKFFINLSKSHQECSVLKIEYAQLVPSILNRNSSCEMKGCLTFSTRNAGANVFSQQQIL